MQANGSVEYCEFCGKKTYHYPDGGCASCLAELLDIPIGQAKRETIAKKDRIIAQAIGGDTNEK